MLRPGLAITDQASDFYLDLFSSRPRLTSHPPTPSVLQYLPPKQLRVCELLLLAGGPGVIHASAVQEEHQVREHLRRFCLFHLALHRAFCEVVLFGCKPRSGTPLLSRLDGFAGPRCLIAQFVGVQAGKRLGQLRESYRVLTEMRKGRRLGGSR